MINFVKFFKLISTQWKLFYIYLSQLIRPPLSYPRNSNRSDSLPVNRRSDQSSSHLMPCAWRHSAKCRWNAFGPCRKIIENCWQEYLAVIFVYFNRNRITDPETNDRYFARNRVRIKSSGPDPTNGFEQKLFIQKFHEYHKQLL